MDASPPPEALVRIDNVSLAYGRHTVLSDVDLHIHRGEFWFFLGPNGQGKTSLLRELLGVVRPHGGRITFASALAGRERIAFVPQQCEMNPTLPTTVREFVLLGLVGIRVPRSDEKSRLAYALDKVGIGHMEGRNYWTLSGGQRQRALVARALVRRPDLLILDEPFSGLDLPTEDVLLQLLAALHAEQGLTLIFVTHDLPVAERYGTHAALFGEGRVHTGLVHDVLHPEHLGRAFKTDFSGIYDRARLPAREVPS